MFGSVVVVDCANHMLGRLAAMVAKELLNGQRIVLVRCEETNISGSLYRNKLKFDAFLRKSSNSNPSRSSHIHYRNPNRIVWRTIRGMLPHKTPRGAAALSRLETFEGVPEQFEKVKRQVIPSAVRAVCLKPHRAYCRLGDVALRVGWKHNDLLKRLEDRRKARSAAYYEKRKEVVQKFRDAQVAATKSLSKDEQQILASAGYA